MKKYSPTLFLILFFTCNHTQAQTSAVEECSKLYDDAYTIFIKQRVKQYQFALSKINAFKLCKPDSIAAADTLEYKIFNEIVHDKDTAERAQKQAELAQARAEKSEKDLRKQKGLIEQQLKRVESDYKIMKSEALLNPVSRLDTLLTGCEGDTTNIVARDEFKRNFMAEPFVFYCHNSNLFSDKKAEEFLITHNIISLCPEHLRLNTFRIRPDSILPISLPQNSAIAYTAYFQNVNNNTVVYSQSRYLRPDSFWVYQICADSFGYTNKGEVVNACPEEENIANRYILLNNKVFCIKPITENFRETDRYCIYSVTDNKPLNLDLKKNGLTFLNSNCKSINGQLYFWVVYDVDSMRNNPNYAYAIHHVFILKIDSTLQITDSMDICYNTNMCNSDILNDILSYINAYGEEMLIFQFERNVSVFSKKLNAFSYLLTPNSDKVFERILLTDKNILVAKTSLGIDIYRIKPDSRNFPFDITGERSIASKDIRDIAVFKDNYLACLYSPFSAPQTSGLLITCNLDKLLKPKKWDEEEKWAFPEVKNLFNSSRREINKILETK